MSPTIPVATFGWLFVVLLLFRILPARKAAFLGLIAGWMLLPVYDFDFPGIPDYGKVFAVGFPVLLATFLFHLDLVRQLRLCWHDAIAVGFCIAPFFSAIDNGLGAYNGLSETNDFVVLWMFPYLIGRIYLTSIDALRDLMGMLFVSGLVYAPFCVLEMLVSPQMHNWVYGFHAHQFLQAIRGDSYRPLVFMSHGLMVAMWMLAALISGLTLWYSGQFRTISELKVLGLHSFRPVLLIGSLIVVFVASKSLGALLLAMFGLGVVFVALKRGHRSILILLCLVAPVYLAIRLGIGLDYDGIISRIATISEDRAASLQFRVDQEVILLEKAIQQPLFGWGGFGRSRVYDEWGQDRAVTDSLWIILMGINGSYALIFFMLFVLVPPAQIFLGLPPGFERSPAYIIMIGTSLILTLYSMDCLVNDMNIPVFSALVGGLATVRVNLRQPVLQAPSNLHPHYA